MRINEITTISGNSIEKLKNIEIYNEVDRIYNRLKTVSDSAPSLMAIDILGEDLEDYRIEINNLLIRVKKLYLPTDNTYQRVVEIWKYINQ